MNSIRARIPTSEKGRDLPGHRKYQDIFHRSHALSTRAMICQQEQSGKLSQPRFADSSSVFRSNDSSTRAKFCRQETCLVGRSNPGGCRIFVFVHTSKMLSTRALLCRQEHSWRLSHLRFCPQEQDVVDKSNALSTGAFLEVVPAVGAVWGGLSSEKKGTDFSTNHRF